MKHYYEKKLASNRLKQVYDLAPPRIRQYLKAETDFAIRHLKPDNLVLDLGCGYGRQFPELCRKARFVVGIDSSGESLALGQEFLRDLSGFVLIQMNAQKLLFPDEAFDVVLCLQNGISAFHVDMRKLILEAIRVTRKGGIILFSSYSGKLWKERLKWFQLQSDAGLLGIIDYEKTRNGKIVCEDGFTATTVDDKKFHQLISGISGIHASVTEIDESIIFLKILRQ
ncbi:MAG: class I SAM-dependent methyltransferase [Bacteroidales bacterium]|nr:class I SAM-dependent methyltransferase [Bacteroidales bacterium]